MKFSEVIDQACQGELVRPYKGHNWIRLQQDGRWKTEKGALYMPSVLELESDTWEVNQRMFTFGACLTLGGNEYISFNRHSGQIRKGVGPNFISREGESCFPLDTPTRYKLVLAPEGE